MEDFALRTFERLAGLTRAAARAYKRRQDVLAKASGTWIPSRGWSMASANPPRDGAEAGPRVRVMAW